jgi:hypothetical protein
MGPGTPVRLTGRTVSFSSRVPGAKSGLATVSCPAGTRRWGGGATLVGSGGTDGAIHDSYPDPNSRTWDVRAIIIFAGSGSLKVTPWVLCIS